MHDLLSGVRVVDFTTIVLGPYATQLLGDLGADVIKVEPLSGDQFRAVRPGRSADMGHGYLNLNRNKRSIALDLASQEGREVIARLLATADVVAHNMRLKSAAKLGISYEAARAARPDVVYCYAPGFGKDGPRSEEPAYDDTIQAASSLAYVNAVDGAPRFVPTIMGDKVCGLHLALAVLAGLAARARTGEGCCIEAPMFESLVSFLMVEQLAGQSFEPPLGGMGYERMLSPNRKPYATKDGYIAMLPYSTAHWTRFLEAVGREDMLAHDWVTDPVQRSKNIDALYRLLAEITPERTTEEWLELLARLDVPCTRVNKPADLLEDPHLQAVGLFQEVAHPTEGRLRGVRSPFVVSDEAPQADGPAPRLGGDTAAILAELGYDEGAVEDLAARGVVRIGESESHPATA